MVRLPRLAIISFAVAGAAYAAAGEMVTIPAGAFRMGSDQGEADERPAHTVVLPAFQIDRAPVTNAQFALFLDAKSARDPQGKRYFDDDDPDAQIHLRGGRWQADRGFEEKPAIEATWLGARAYCEWRGARLPTEAEWEKAARNGMAPGSVWQWVSSAYRPYPYRAEDGREAADGDVVRGTRGFDPLRRGTHVSRNPKAGHHNIGFRCAK